MNVDFPGVTICPNSKIMKSKFRAAMNAKNLPWLNITKKLEDANTGAGAEFQFNLLNYISNLILFNSNPGLVVGLQDKNTQDLLDGMSGNISSLMRTLAPDCKRMIVMCRWQGEFRNCSEMFTSSKTDDGFCCSFNTISLAEGFAKPENLEEDSEGTNDYDYDYSAAYYDYGVGSDYEYSDVGDNPAYDTW